MKYNIIVVNDYTNEEEVTATVKALGDAIIIRDSLTLNCTITNISYKIKECSIPYEVIYKGWQIEKGHYGNYYEATNLKDCDSYMIVCKTIEQIKVEIDE